MQDDCGELSFGFGDVRLGWALSGCCAEPAGAKSLSVPAHVAVDMYVRDVTTASAEELVERVTKAAHGVAMATETTANVGETGPLHADRRNNTIMADRFSDVVSRLGLSIAPGPPEEPAGSSDIGNLSQLLPIIHPYVQITEHGTPGHSEAMRIAAVTDLAHERTAIAASGLAQIVTDLLHDPGFLGTVRAEFEES